MTERLERCGRCRFWESGNFGKSHIGECRRYPQVSPTKNESDWCGEFVLLPVVQVVGKPPQVVTNPPESQKAMPRTTQDGRVIPQGGSSTAPAKQKCSRCEAAVTDLYDGLCWMCREDEKMLKPLEIAKS